MFRLAALHLDHPSTKVFRIHRWLSPSPSRISSTIVSAREFSPMNKSRVMRAQEHQLQKVHDKISSPFRSLPTPEQAAYSLSGKAQLHERCVRY
jgi:hypothetical protein